MSTVDDIIKSLAPEVSAAAFNYIKDFAGDYIRRLLEGDRLTPEEKDDFYAVLDKASRMG